MNNDEIKSDLRAVLDKVIANEKERVTSILSEGDEKLTQQKAMLAPIISTLNALAKEVGDVEGLSIRPAPPGQQITVETKTSSTDHSYIFSTTADNSKYKMRHSSSFIGDYSSSEKHYDSAEEIVQIAVEAVGKHIGAQQAHSERK